MGLQRLWSPLGTLGELSQGQGPESGPWECRAEMRVPGPGGRRGPWAKGSAEGAGGAPECRTQGRSGRVRGLAGAEGGCPWGGARYVFKSCLSAGCSCLASPRDSGDSLPADTMTIDGPVALFKSSTNCSRAPFSAPGPYCWSGPLKARPGPEPPEAPARVQPCASPARRLPARLPGRGR